MNSLLPSLSGELAKLADVLVPMVKAAYIRGVVDGAIGAVVVLLAITMAMSQKR